MQKQNEFQTQKSLFQEKKLYVAANLALIRNIGDSEAILLNYLLGIRDWYNRAVIFKPSREISQDLGWSGSKVERIINKLEGLGLIQVKIKAWPPIHNFHFNEARIRDAIFDNMKTPRKKILSSQNDKIK
jgi:hypothetical protein